MKLDRLFSHWDEVRGGLLAIVEEFDAAGLSYRPFKGSRTAGQIMLHIANAEEGWFRYAVTQELADWPEEVMLEAYPTVEAIRALLSAVHDRTATLLAKLDQTEMKRVVEVPWGESLSLGWIIWHVLEHEIHHRGELSLILGMLGREGLDV